MNESFKGKYFFAYHAGHLAINKEKPWQILTYSLPAVCGKVATREQAIIAIEALDNDKDAGILPLNLSTWDKHQLLE